MRALALLGALLLSSVALAAEPLTLWHAYRGAEEDALLQVVERYTKETGQKVDLLALPYDAFSAKLTNAIPHDAGPDVFIFAHERLRSFARNRLVATSDEFIDRGAYFPNAIEALEIDGSVFGYPLSLKCVALYVNKKLIPTPPTTTSELLSMAKAHSSAKDNRFGLAYESGDFYLHAPFLFGFGGKLFDDAGKARFDDPALGKSLAFVKGMQDAQYLPSEVSGALVKSLFNDGRAAMVISGPWFAGEISGVDYALAALPTVDETGIPMRPFLGVEAAFVSARSKQIPAAQALARYLSIGSGAETRAVVGRQVPAAKAAYDSPEIANDALISSFRAAAERATPMPNTLEMSKVWEPMKLTLRAVLQGGTEPEHAGALADRRYRALNREAPEKANPWPWFGLLMVGTVATGTWAYRRNRPTQSFARRYPDALRAVAYVGPAAAALSVLVIVPFVIGISLAFFHHDAGEYTFVGFSNFIDILASRGYRITEPLSFYFTLVVTVLWAFINVALHVTIGLFLALLLKDPLLKFRGVYRVLLIVPWAVPNYITALMWKGMFHKQFGAINGLLQLMGVEPVSWFTRWSTSFAANVATNTWLGFPFMMVVALGALQSIPQDLYEAAEVDGASKWTQFKKITLPLLRPALLPSVILGSVWTFNMFNIIYLVSGGEPGGGTDILVSEAFRWAFQRNEQYGFAAAYSVLIFLVLLGYSAITKRISKGADEVLG